MYIYKHTHIIMARNVHCTCILTSFLTSIVSTYLHVHLSMYICMYKYIQREGHGIIAWNTHKGLAQTQCKCTCGTWACRWVCTYVLYTL